jgi:hypothetical protein
MVIIGNTYYIYKNRDILLYIYIIKTDDIKLNICNNKCKAPSTKPKKTGLN